MSISLEDLKTRLENAQKQLAEATERLTHAQKVHQYATYEVNTWNAAVNIETQREEQREKAPTAPTVTASATPAQNIIKPAPQPTESSAEPQELNKTEMIRALLRQHTTGLTPSELWKQVKGQFAHRPYLYSVLKRLKDRDEVTVKRGKYLLKVIPKVEDDQKPSSTVVQ